MKKRAHLLPSHDLIRHIARTKGAQGLSELRMDQARCRKCNALRLFPGPLVLGLQSQGVGIPAMVLAAELPKSGERSSWRHAWVLDYPVSVKLGGPQYKNTSQCDRCEDLDVLQTMREDEARSRRLLSEGLPSDFSLSRCADCPNTRAETSLSGLVGFGGAHGAPCGVVHLFEVDPKRDGRPGGGVPERWVFTGVLDLSRGVSALSYRWRCRCPACHQKRVPGGHGSMFSLINPREVQ